MSSKFSPARPRRQTPPQCKKKAPPPPGTTPVITYPEIEGLPLYLAVSWNEVSPLRPWAINGTFLLNSTGPFTWSTGSKTAENAVWQIGLIYLQTVGTFQITGSVSVDGVFEDSLSSGIQSYETGQPFVIPYRRQSNTHNPTPTPAEAFVGITI